MYHQQISAYEETLRASGVTSMVFNGGPASFLCSFPAEDQTDLGYLFFIEFFVDSYIVSTSSIFTTIKHMELMVFLRGL